MSSKLFDESDWPRDARLDPFRDAVWELHLDGHLAAHLTTQVIPMRSLPGFGRKQEWLWFQVTWLDGRRDPAEEDYGPGWYTVADLEAGNFEHAIVGATLHFQAQPVSGAERTVLWDRYGPPR